MLQRNPVYLDVLVTALRARKLLHETPTSLHPKEFVTRAAADWNMVVQQLAQQPIQTNTPSLLDSTNGKTVDSSSPTSTNANSPTTLNIKSVSSSLGKIGASYYKRVLIPFLLFHEYILRVRPSTESNASSTISKQPPTRTMHVMTNHSKPILPGHLCRLTRPSYGSFYERVHPKTIPLHWVTLLHRASALLTSLDTNNSTTSSVDINSQMKVDSTSSARASTDPDNFNDSMDSSCKANENFTPNKDVQKSLKDRFAYYYVRTTSSMSRKKRHAIKEGNRWRKYRAKKALRKERSKLRLISLIRKSSNTARNILRMKFGDEKYTKLLAEATNRRSSQGY